MAVENLTSREKAAILMIALGKNYAAKLYTLLPEDEVEQLTLSITNMRRVSPRNQRCGPYRICGNVHGPENDFGRRPGCSKGDTE